MARTQEAEAALASAAVQGGIPLNEIRGASSLQSGARQITGAEALTTWLTGPGCRRLIGDPGWI
jgi:hypothetical protein